MVMNVPGILVGQSNAGALQVVFVHWPYRQSSFFSQDDPTGLRVLLSEVRLRHLTLESPTMPMQLSHRRSNGIGDFSGAELCRAV